MSYPEFKKIHF